MDTGLTQLFSSFDMMKEKDPDSLALNLADFLGSSSHDDDSRLKCADLLYHLLTHDKGHIWNNLLSASTQSAVKSILLIRINLEESRPITRKLCDTVAELCDIIFLPSNNWPELYPFLQECVTSNSNMLKMSFFMIFAKLAKDVCETLIPDIMTLYPVFLTTLYDDTLNLQMRITTLSATVNFILCLSSLNEVKSVQSLLPAMMRTLTDTLSKKDVVAQYVLILFTKLAKNEPRFFRTQIVDVVNTMLEIAEDINYLEEKTRQSALNFLLTLVEAKEKAPGMMKKLPLFTNNYFALLLKLLLDVKDEPSWHSAENFLDEVGVMDNYKWGSTYLRRFSIALGGKTVAPIAIEQLDDYLVSPEWEKRHGALAALAYIAEGCSKGMIKYLEQVVNMVLHSFQDPHPRVRWAAIRSIAQLSTDLSPDLQERHHSQVVPALAAAMDDFQNRRVQVAAAVAVSNYFCKSEKPETLISYLDAILSKLLVLLQNDNQMVQQVALHALTGVAESSKEHFQKYYDLVMPYLKITLAKANDKSNHMLRSKALGCITMVGNVVGRENFRDDIEQVIEELKLSQESQVKEFGTVMNIIKAWVRICRCMGKDFLPYMSTVMPLLVKCALLEPINIMGKLENSIHKVKFGDEVIYTKGSDFVEVKSLACGIFGLYAELLKEDFYPWIPEATSILVPLLKVCIHVRERASTAMFQLLNSANLAVKRGNAQGENELYFKQLSCDIILALGDALYVEHETKVCAHILSKLSSCLLICKPAISEDMLYTIMVVIKHVITESSCRKGELAEREKAEDFDAEEAELLREKIQQEEAVSRLVGQILRIFVDTFKAAFLPFFDELSSYLMPIRGKDKTPAERFASIFIFTGLVMQCGDAALKYYNIYLPFLLDSSNDENPAVREIALDGLGLCAEYGVSIFKPFVGESLSRINTVITHLHARVLENENAYYFAVSALGTICHFHQESIDSAQIIPAWLHCLPAKSISFVAKPVHNQLCSTAERLETILLGPKYEHFPKILSVFAEVLCAGNDLATEDTVNRMINVLRNLHKTIPPATWASAVSLLLPQQEMEVEYVLLPQENANSSSANETIVEPQTCS